MSAQAQSQEDPALNPGELLPGARPSLGVLLIDAGIATEEQVAQAVRVGAETGERLGDVMLRHGWATEDEVALLISRQWQLPFATPDVLTAVNNLPGGDELARLGGVAVRPGCAARRSSGTRALVALGARTCSYTSPPVWLANASVWRCRSASAPGRASRGACAVQG